MSPVVQIAIRLVPVALIAGVLSGVDPPPLPELTSRPAAACQIGLDRAEAVTETKRAKSKSCCIFNRP
jgi:hypothetical protein